MDNYSENSKIGTNDTASDMSDWLKPNLLAKEPNSYGNTKSLSFGETLVGITFNPSNDGDVNFIKTKMAEVANLINERYQSQETSPLSKLIYESSISEILNAQMNAVKFVTLKY